MRILAKRARTSFHWFLFFENAPNTFWMFEGDVPVALREFIKQHNKMVEKGISSLSSHQDLLENICNRFNTLTTKYDLGEHNEFMTALVIQDQSLQVGSLSQWYKMPTALTNPGHVQVEIDKLNTGN
ncbi:hypothetical protein [Bacteriophage Eos]|nr:hypothetical protein [Bacteriophage Eos]